MNKTTNYGCVIEVPSFHLAIPLLDFDPETCITEIIQSQKDVMHVRFNPLHAIVRGMGGGKTRIVTELCLAALKFRNVLPIAVTYNFKWEWPAIEDELSSIIHSSDNKILADWGLAIRILSSFFDKSPQHILEAMYATSCPAPVMVY